MPTTMRMSELTEVLRSKNIEAVFEMSGGGIGTIYIGDYDKEGNYEFAVGPSSFFDDEAYYEEICWGVDGSEEATYYTGTPEDFTPEKVADLIESDYRKAKN